MIDILMVGVGGFIGSVFRYLLSLLNVPESYSFPIKTFLTNIIGAFVIGLIAAFAFKHCAASPKLLLFLKVGVCGGFTTFSTFALESLELFQKGQVNIAFIYIVASVTLSIAAVWLAEILVR